MKKSQTEITDFPCEHRRDSRRNHDRNKNMLCLTFKLDIRMGQGRCKHANRKPKRDFVFDDDGKCLLYLTICEVFANEIKYQNLKMKIKLKE